MKYDARLPLAERMEKLKTRRTVPTMRGRQMQQLALLRLDYLYNDEYCAKLLNDIARQLSFTEEFMRSLNYMTLAKYINSMFRKTKEEQADFERAVVYTGELLLYLAKKKEKYREKRLAFLKNDGNQ